MVLRFLEPRVDAPVVTTVPGDRPARFVRVWRNGGPAVNRVLERALVTVEGWSLDSVDASALTGACRDALLHDYTGMPLVRGVSEVTGPYSIPDPESGTPRYRFTMQLNVRARRTGRLVKKV